MMCTNEELKLNQLNVIMVIVVCRDYALFQTERTLAISSCFNLKWSTNILEYLAYLVCHVKVCGCCCCCYSIEWVYLIDIAPILLLHFSFSTLHTHQCVEEKTNTKPINSQFDLIGSVINSTLKLWQRKNPTIWNVLGCHNMCVFTVHSKINQRVLMSRQIFAELVEAF